MRRSLVGSLVLTVAVAAGGVAVSGCGGSSSIDPVAKAASLSTSSPGYRMRFAVQISSPQLPSPVNALGTGKFDVPAHSGALVMNMDLSGIPQVQQALGSSTLRLEEIVNGTTFYLRLPTTLTSRVPTFGNKPWLKIDLAKASSAAGIPGISSLLNSPVSSDPSQFLQYLRASSGNVTKLGAEVVDGLQTTHYRATIDLDRVPNALPASSRAAARSAISALESRTGLHQLPVNVWIDQQNRVRRMRMVMNLAASGQSVSTAITVDIVEYGPQTPPMLPAASEVTDVSSLPGSGG